MKLAILGGGGFRVPQIYRALLRDTGTPRVDEVTLYDPEPARLDVIGSVLAQLAGGTPDAPRVDTTTELDKALDGSSFVFSAIRVGGLPARIQDERVALRLGVLGQETTGPGGIAFGLRTVPVAVRIAERVAEVAPEAYVVNFTNPAGLITEAMQAVLGERVVGICDTPTGLARRIAGALGLEAARLRFDYVGLNHLGWMRRVFDDGRDRLPELLADDEALAGLEETEVFGASWLRALGAIPNEYLFYYYFTRDAIRSIGGQESTRGEFLARQQQAFYDAASAAPGQALDRWRRTNDERRALYMAEARATASVHRDDSNDNDDDDKVGDDEGYEGVALAVLAAIARDERTTIILNVRNGGTLDGLDDAAVVEVPATVDANGVHPLPAAPPALHQIGLMQQVKAVERLVVEAALTGSQDAALKAFALHPLVDSVSVARDLLTGYLAEIPEVAAVLGHRTGNATSHTSSAGPAVSQSAK